MRRLSCFAIVPFNRGGPKGPTVLVKDARRGLVEQILFCNATRSCEAYRNHQGPSVNYDEVYEHIIQAAIADVNKSNTAIEISCLRGVDIPQGGSIASQLTEQICRADITITDITSANPNVFLELGIRLAVRNELNIILCHQGTIVPFNLEGYRYIPYSLDVVGGQKAKNQIVEFIQSYVQQPVKTTSAPGSYYHNVNHYTGRETELAQLHAFVDAPELVADLASQILKPGRHLKVKTNVIQFFERLGRVLELDARGQGQAIKHYKLMSGIAGLSNDDKYKIFDILCRLCSADPDLADEASFYKLEMEKLESA